MKKFTLLLFLILISFSYARKPAIEPVTGISIDEYQDGPATGATGFDFTAQKSKNLQGQQLAQNSPADGLPVSLMIFLAFLPFAISLLILRKLKHSRQTTASTNTIDLNEHRQKKKQQEEDLKLPKAS